MSQADVDSLININIKNNIRGNQLTRNITSLDTDEDVTENIFDQNESDESMSKPNDQNSMNEAEQEAIYNRIKHDTSFNKIKQDTSINPEKEETSFVARERDKTFKDTISKIFSDLDKTLNYINTDIAKSSSSDDENEEPKMLSENILNVFKNKFENNQFKNELSPEKVKKKTSKEKIKTFKNNFDKSCKMSQTLQMDLTDFEMEQEKQISNKSSEKCFSNQIPKMECNLMNTQSNKFYSEKEDIIKPPKQNIKMELDLSGTLPESNNLDSLRDTNNVEKSIFSNNKILNKVYEQVYSIQNKPKNSLKNEKKTTENLIEQNYQKIIQKNNTNLNQFNRHRMKSNSPTHIQNCSKYFVKKTKVETSPVSIRTTHKNNLGQSKSYFEKKYLTQPELPENNINKYIKINSMNNVSQKYPSYQNNSINHQNSNLNNKILPSFMSHQRNFTKEDTLKSLAVNEAFTSNRNNKISSNSPSINRPLFKKERSHSYINQNLLGSEEIVEIEDGLISLFEIIMAFRSQLIFLKKKLFHVNPNFDIRIFVMALRKKKSLSDFYDFRSFLDFCHKLKIFSSEKEIMSLILYIQKNSRYQFQHTKYSFQLNSFSLFEYFQYLDHVPNMSSSYSLEIIKSEYTITREIFLLTLRMIQDIKFISSTFQKYSLKDIFKVIFRSTSLSDSPQTDLFASGFTGKFFNSKFSNSHLSNNHIYHANKQSQISDNSKWFGLSSHIDCSNLNSDRRDLLSDKRISTHSINQQRNNKLLRENGLLKYFMKGSVIQYNHPLQQKPQMTSPCIKSIIEPSTILSFFEFHNHSFNPHEINFIFQEIAKKNYIDENSFAKYLSADFIKLE